MILTVDLSDDDGPPMIRKKNLFKKCCHWKWIIQKYWPLTNYFVLQKKREEKFSNVGGIGLKHSSLHWRRFSHSGREMCRWGAKTKDLFSLFFFLERNVCPFHLSSSRNYLKKVNPTHWKNYLFELFCYGSTAIFGFKTWWKTLNKLALLWCVFGNKEACKNSV